MTGRYSALIPLGGFILLGAVSANAADLEAKIPFTFQFGGAILPAGQYDFRFDFSELPGVLRVERRDGRGGAFVLTQKADIPQGWGDQPKLIFEKNGDQYVLSEVFDPGFSVGVRLLNPRPRGEERTGPSTD